MTNHVHGGFQTRLRQKCTQILRLIIDDRKFKVLEISKMATSELNHLDVNKFSWFDYNN